MKNIVLSGLMAFSFLFIMSSCGTDPAAALQDEVIEVHDIVMPKMPTLNILADSMSVLENWDAVVAAGDVALVTRIKNDLIKADEDMHHWMKEFKMNTGDTTYLKEEMEKISMIGKLTDDAIKDARRILSVYDN